MAKKPRRAVVHSIIKNLLDSEIPEIQSMANNLAEQIKELEEQSSRLQKYVAQIESLATEEDNAMTESQIADILQNLDNALDDLRKRPKKALPGGKPASLALDSPATRRDVITREPEKEAVEDIEGLEETTPKQGMQLETYTTPEGYLIKKSRI
jgi:DNA repair exonuclease SbcCD ATPase subunit